MVLKQIREFLRVFFRGRVSSPVWKLARFVLFPTAVVFLSFQNCTRFTKFEAKGLASGVVAGSSFCATNPGSETCFVAPASKCMFNGTELAEGVSVVAYLASTVPAGQTCTYQTRTCKSGVLSGSYDYALCGVQKAAACLFDGKTIPSGSKITAYLNLAGSNCSSEERLCTNGQLSGSYPYGSCLVGACRFNGQTIANGTSVTGYDASAVDFGKSCTPNQRTCYNGGLSSHGDYASCVVGQPKSCLFNGQTLAHGSSVKAYTTSTVPFGSSCSSEDRVCNNGNLSGSATFGTCAPEAHKACLLSGQTIPHGGTVTSYASSLADANDICFAEVRTCNEGVLSGDPQKTFLSCTIPGPTLPKMTTCADGGTCLSFVDIYGTSRSVYINNTPFTGIVETDFIGTHPLPGGESHQLGYVYFDMGVNNAAALEILDFQTSQIIAATYPPSNVPLWAVNLGVMKGPEGRRYPFLTPGYTSMRVGAGHDPAWQYLCTFDPATIATPDAACILGFRKVPLFNFITVTGQSVLEVAPAKQSGFWMKDLDGDGFEDFNIQYYLGFLQTISGRTGETISASQFDFAMNEPGYDVANTGDQNLYYKYYHGGRWHGGYSTFTNPDNGATSEMVTSGDAVGRFDSPVCNNLRFVSSLTWNGGAYQVNFAHWFGWSRTIWLTPEKIWRPGNDLRSCIHRFSDSLVQPGGRPYSVTNLFTPEDSAGKCDQLAFEYQTDMTNDKFKTYYKCLTNFELPKVGRWDLYLWDAANGLQRNGIVNRYAWGKAEKVWPGQIGPVLLLQQFQGNVPFHSTSESAWAYSISAVDANAQVIDLGLLVGGANVKPVVNVGTKTKNANGSFPEGTGSALLQIEAGNPELNLEDIDGDGLNDIELENGTWLGYSNGALVKKTRAISSPGLNILSASYGKNCGDSASSDLSMQVRSLCQGKQDCETPVSATAWGASKSASCAKELVVQYYCDDTATKAGSGLRVLTAAYMDYLVESGVNLTSTVGNLCNGKNECSYGVSTGNIGDPAPGFYKDLRGAYTCDGGPIQNFRVTPEANGKSLQLSCRQPRALRLVGEADGQNLKLSCGNPQRRIKIQSATYGGNAKAALGNSTEVVAKTCDGLLTCMQFVSPTTFGDPLPGIAKDFKVRWTCGGMSVKEITLPAPAMANLTISCESM